MSLFTSSKEKKLWLGALIVLIAIFSTLFITQPLIQLFDNQDLEACVFIFGMILVGGVVILHTITLKPSKIETIILLGIIAVYVLFFLRQELPERSHLIEYSVLAIFIHKAIIERANQGAKISLPALLAFIIVFSIGVLDECVQIFIPYRVFDLNDIIFNGFAVALAIGSRVVLVWVRGVKSCS